MNTNKEYRNGPVGALMDEYERAADELKVILNEISQDDFIKIVDHDTKDPDCQSIQAIMNHVVSSGFGYSNYLRKQFGYKCSVRKEDYEICTIESAKVQLDNMLKHTVESLDNKWNLTFDDVVNSKIKTSWGQVYDVEQLLEHGIVHILRHRRQIEKLLIKIKSSNLHNT